MTITGLVANQGTYGGVFVVTLASLMDEILLTRIFSVTTWYHFAFVAISIAMFGMSLGAILVYFQAGRLAMERTKEYMAYSSMLFGVTVLLALFAQLYFPFRPGLTTEGLVSAAFTYGVISVPFVFSGICVCLALTRFPAQISGLYAADLAGAACGCAVTIGVLKMTDALTAVVAVALLALLGAAWLAADAGENSLRSASLAGCAVLGIFVITNTVEVNRQHPLIRVEWVKEQKAAPPLYEKWNSYSRIAVVENPKVWAYPISAGISATYVPRGHVRELNLTIDGSAETTLTSYDGKVENLDYLKYDAKEFVHYLRPHASVLVIGAGGGRDILAALAFGQESVRAVEVNGDVLRAVNGRYGDFTGHLDKDPRITFVSDEARSYLARIGERFDIIQASFIDTWAATAAGAFALTENSLYTVQAWKLFLGRLSPSGMVSFSRWFFPGNYAEGYRLTALAAESLHQLGVSNPRRHIIMITNLRKFSDSAWTPGVCTLLVSREPFSPEDVGRAEEVAHRLKFDIVLSPKSAQDSVFESLAENPDVPSVAAGFPFDISPPTDDRPFFFQMVRLRDAFFQPRSSQTIAFWNAKAVDVLASLLVTVVIFTGLAFIVPLGLRTEKPALRSAFPYFVYFAALGLGYMLIEVAQLERLIIFLGHPTYALSVVLFTLLLSSGVGSYCTRNIGENRWTSAGFGRLGLLVCVLLVIGPLTPAVTLRLAHWATSERIVVALALLFPMGFFMGMAFPLGMRIACKESNTLTPWLWGINGATSVCASVLAVAIALVSGISAAFWWGSGAYAVSLLAFYWMRASGKKSVTTAILKTTGT